MMNTTKRVLVADDEVQFRKTLSLVFRSKGFTVVEAGNAKHALEHIRAEMIPFDILILDLVMPVKGGIDLLREFQGTPEKLPPVLIVSGEPREDTMPNIHFPIAGYLSKPFNIDELCAEVARVLSINKNDNNPKYDTIPKENNR